MGINKSIRWVNKQMKSGKESDAKNKKINKI
jgi:hypothetical protein